MKHSREHLINIFTELGKQLGQFGHTPDSCRVIDHATADNEWFTREDIVCAVESICNDMLQHEQLVKWLAAYPDTKHRDEHARNVGVIMAGNIPLVGFFDLLCVVICGHKCFVKPSSKDRVLITYICSLLHEIDPQITIVELGQAPLDAVIATGSDNTNRYFRAQYGAIPSLLRSSRASLAVLSGSESAQELSALASDIFMYNGLGCRSVSKIFVPSGYNVQLLQRALTAYNGSINQKYRNNYLQNKALRSMHNDDFIDGGFFLMHQQDEFPSAISEIAYSFYNGYDDINNWITAHSQHIQCISSDHFITPQTVSLGTTQHPALTDYPDSCDVVCFLQSLP